jgi:CHAT domain-containing protein
VLLQATLELAEGNTLAVLERLLDRGEAVRPFSLRGQSRAAALIGEAHLLEGHPALALASLKEARQLAERWEVRVEAAHANTSSGAAVLGEWLGLSAVVLEAQALSALGRELEAAVLIERAHGFRWREAARADHLGIFADEATLGTEDLKAWAANYELGLVTWVLGADSGLAIHVSASGVARSHAVELSRRAVGRGVQRFRTAVLQGSSSRSARLGQEIGNALFPETLASALQQNDTTDARVLLLLHGELERLPFEALPVGPAYLDDIACPVALPELPSKLPGSAPTQPFAWTLLGNPLDRDQLVLLPAAEEELEQLSELLPSARLFSGEHLTPGNFTEALSSGGALHVATHLGKGASCASPRFSGVRLQLTAGDSLCAETIAQCASPSPLVVLAACESAEGRLLDSRGLQGVARAFLDSGARNLLVTLWPIRDDVAGQASLLYHRALLEGKSPARAAQAMRQLLAQSGVEAADWAAFRALGRE